jgi:hypothetical protein
MTLLALGLVTEIEAIVRNSHDSDFHFSSSPGPMIRSSSSRTAAITIDDHTAFQWNSRCHFFGIRLQIACILRPFLFWILALYQGGTARPV